MNPKQKVIFGATIFLIGAILLIGLSYYAEQKQTLDLDEFTVDVPAGSTFNITEPRYGENLGDFATVYTCKDENLIITHLDKKFIEDSFKNHTGKSINFTEICVNYIEGIGAQKINQTSDHITIYKVNLNGRNPQTAGVYQDSENLILVEGFDQSLVEEITDTIKIK